MLSVKQPDAIHVRLIECQSRDTSSHAVIDKIQAIRNNSDHNRFVFVHEAPLSDAVRGEFSQHGIVVYPFDEFAAFIAETNTTLRGIAATQGVPATFVPSSPPMVRAPSPAPTFQPSVEKGLGSSGISNKAGFGNICRPGFGKGR
jgi:hypothetical protein